LYKQYTSLSIRNKESFNRKLLSKKHNTNNAKVDFHCKIH